MPKFKPVGFILVFFVALLPWISTFVNFYPDEKYYMDGGTIMRQSGEYLIPYTPEGEIRLRKPVLPYWVTSSSYAVLGVNGFAARLPFLLAGCAIVWLTRRLALEVFGNQYTANLAAIIVASNPQVLLASMRSMPDVLQCLFVLIAAYGFVKALFGPNARGGFLGYVGATLAVATKGFIGMVFVGYAWVYALFNRKRGVSPGRLFSVAGLAVLLLLGFGWYALMWHGHREVLVKQFWGDQVGRKLSPGQSLYNLPLFVLRSLVALLPWTLVLGECIWRNRSAFLPANARERKAAWFLWLWFAVLPLIFGFGINPSFRYSLPAVPLLAVVMADVIRRSEPNLKWFTGRRLFNFFLGLLLVVAVAGWGVLGFPMPLGVAIILAGAAITTTLWFVCRKRAWITPFEATGLALVALMPLTFVGFQSVALPSDATQIRAKLDQIGFHGPSIGAVIPPNVGTRLRMECGGRLKVVREDTLSPNLLTNYPVIVFRESDASVSPDQGYKVELAAQVIERIKAGPLLAAVMNGRGQEFWRTNRANYFVAYKP